MKEKTAKCLVCGHEIHFREDVLYIPDEMISECPNCTDGILDNYEVSCLPSRKEVERK